MGAFNRETLIAGMKEFDNQMGTSHTDDWYEAISWTGLRETKAWQDFQTKNPEKATQYVSIINEEINKLGGNNDE